MTLNSTVLPILDYWIERFESFRKATNYSDFSDISKEDASEFIVGSTDVIYRISGSGSQYAERVDDFIKKCQPHHIAVAIPHVGGALKALRHAVEKNYLIDLQELVHADVFGDFIEMAVHLHTEGYKDAAAVMGGGVLEEHIRKLCTKNSIALEYLDSKGIFQSKKADSMNAELAGQEVYSKLDQKNITAWLDLRNKAAHGHYSEYSSDQVGIFLQSVRDFIARHPA